MLRQAPLAATPRSRRLFVPPVGFDEILAYTSRGYNVLVLGERGGGKTSSLRQLQFMLGEEPHPDDPEVAFVDLGLADDVEHALQLIVHGGRAANGVVPSGLIET